MFRMPPQIDPAEEKKRVQADVRNNFIMFTVLCAAIRLGMFFFTVFSRSLILFFIFSSNCLRKSASLAFGKYRNKLARARKFLI